ncbi:MAG: hypothetical protein CSA75_02870 [Sorangium cellulosum]|nr:MAG: hypothetical protein CSA75_02870 [Sorangium cellulosum]
MLILAGCSPQPKRVAEPEPILQDFTSSPNVELQVACTPTGMETCFDAIDNNCNGVIDEGCGVRTGIIQFSIAWSDPQADVDLLVRDPKGELAKTYKTTNSGLVKDRACPGKHDACQGQNTENVYLANHRIPHGKYRVLVRLNRLGQAQPLRVQVGARVGQRSYATVLEFEAVGDERLMMFEM